ncbi:MAG: hypothetical protein K2X27_22535 [Candidatus Obscuribacterales bacterium]|nr:hypothetical protein [Candidatus Obscuribacterales bacterium]
MSELFCYFIGILVALYAVLLIAFPDRLLPEMAARKKRFTARHWGNYESNAGEPSDSKSDNEESIEVGSPGRKIRHVVGSSTYAGGRGVSMRG